MLRKLTNIEIFHKIRKQKAEEKLKKRGKTKEKAEGQSSVESTTSTTTTTETSTQETGSDDAKIKSRLALVDSYYLKLMFKAWVSIKTMNLVL